MFAAMLASANKRAKVVLTVDLTDAQGGSRLHQTFHVKKWTTRDDAVMVTVEVAGSGDWASGTFPIRVLQLNEQGTTTIARDERNADKLLQYAARAALTFARTGETLTAPNGTVAVVEESTCGACGRELTDPVSIERGIGPECFGKSTGTKTITSRKRTPVTEGA